MPYYRFDNGLQPLNAPPENWQGVLAVLAPAELHDAPLPDWLEPPVIPAEGHDARFCRLAAGKSAVTGHLRTPPRGSQSARRVSFTWANGALLTVDPDHVAADCIGHLAAQRSAPPHSADTLLAALLLTLIRDDLSYTQQLETRLTNLEQDVLDNKTDRFLHRMSVIRKELNRANRFYVQLADFASSLLEETEDLFTGQGKKRLRHFLRRVENLRDETRMLHEYATQISSEYQSQVDIAQNRVMTVLTIVTAIFLPLTLIAGWYGMNFPGMPLLHWRYGYPVVVAVSLLVVAGLILYFKKKKWF